MAPIYHKVCERSLTKPRSSDVEVSLPDKARVAALLEKANNVSAEAGETLDAILNATAALVEFDENYQAAQELLADTSEVVNDGWNDIGEVGLPGVT